MSGMDAIRAVIKDEILQLLATGVVALLLIGMVAVLDGYLTAILVGTNAPLTCGSASCTTMMCQAQCTLSNLSSSTAGLIEWMGYVSGRIGMESSRGVFCNFLGVGYTLVNCSPLNAFRGSITSGSFAATVALADTNAQQFLLSLAQSYAFTFLVPIGLFLRCFKVSRSAGGALIAVGFGFYAVYPTVIVTTDRVLHGQSGPPAWSPVPAPGFCNPLERSSAVALQHVKDYAGQITDYGLTQNLTYFVLVRVLFLSILNLIITLGFIRAFAHLIGSEIDVSALARIS